MTKLFEGRQLEVFVDGTLGVGGHSKAILQGHPEIKLLIGIDKDIDAIEEARKTLWNYQDKLTMVQGDFKDLKQHLNHLGVNQVHGVVLDLGVSSIQLDTARRGFSFTKEGPLDMRMDSRTPLTAKTIVNTFSESQLADIFFHYGEEKKSRSFAKAIVEQRKHMPFETTIQLASFIEKKVGRHGPTHPATRIFQALRIKVNEELEALQLVLEDVLDLLVVNGVACIISFHSLEDRIVKQFIQKHMGRLAYGVKGEKRLEPFTKKPITPSKKEIEENLRSRSAKLRGFIKV